MLILSADTTTPQGSVAIVEGGETRAELRLTARDTYSHRLLPAIEFLLRMLVLPPLEIEGFAVAVGPGSFTGLRVGISTIQGLALATGGPCLGVSALEVMAFAAAGEAPAIVSLRNAFRNEVYWAVHDGQGQPAGPPGVGPLEAALAVAPKEAAFVGDAAQAHRAAIAARLPAARFPRTDPFLAAVLARLAEPRLRAGKGGGPETLRPLYLRGADIRKATA